MDKILSARVEESIVRRIGELAHRLGTSRKQVIERAVLLLAERVESKPEDGVFASTFGAWKRRESAEATVARARRSFKKSLERRT
jgi:predicted transcriptional regulator